MFLGFLLLYLFLSYVNIFWWGQFSNLGPSNWQVVLMTNRPCHSHILSLLWFYFLPYTHDDMTLAEYQIWWLILFTHLRPQNDCHLMKILVKFFLQKGKNLDIFCLLCISTSQLYDGYCSELAYMVVHATIYHI